MKKDYPSRVDFWLAAILIAAPLGSITAGVFTLPKNFGAGMVALLSGVLVGVLVLLLAIPCIYTLSDDSLKIRCGLLEEDLPLHKIRRVEKSRSLWSAPALSLRRVKITLDGDYRLISPKDREGFIADVNLRLAPRSETDAHRSRS